ncbi:pyridoxamine 5'-phosphate oxidase family protein [Culicoidibacter larvae]|uniref:Pyridoxamine 5'-phosphate oxidase family protein n=1 Tax=Culicoidibacter larvae TaxID=2579976 RepID=A0A5R8QDG5_9FIRM|nr:pyridoxamine 5'-phosphate oxidase family protein [Culicoidibacter larvae]TLG74306.1 pyridoxamine 5'-phosphate oxidase family protein [Culicoidibacter larvae]
MYPEMRRKKQALSEAEVVAILERNTSGVLGLNGLNGYPYTVPLSYVYMDGKIYFHCANDGYKMKCMQADNRISFCIIDQDEIVPEEFTTYYRSVILFGKAHLISGPEAVAAAMRQLIAKYSVDFITEGEAAIANIGNSLTIVELEIEHISGKEAKKLMMQR